MQVGRVFIAGPKVWALGSSGHTVVLQRGNKSQFKDSFEESEGLLQEQGTSIESCIQKSLQAAHL